MFVPTRSFIAVGLAAGLLAWAAANASAHTNVASSPQVAAARTVACGSAVSRLADAARGKVNMTAIHTTVDALNATARAATSGRDAFERHAYQVVAQIVRYRTDAAGIHMVLFQGSSYMLGTLPSPTCLPSNARARAVMVATRKWFLKKCGPTSSGWRSLGAQVRITGVGYWGPLNASGAARNGAEFGPVYGINPLAGCGASGA